jgi:hypothetical protein
MSTVIVTGSRLCDWRDWPGIKAALDAAKPTLVVQGGARGADALAARWAAANDVPCETFTAHWALGRTAGPLRNARMLDAHLEALVLAFPRGESRGTWDCIRQAQARGMQVLVLHAPERTALPDLERAWYPQ